MGAYKRPLAEGEVCQDSRVEFNPYLGQGTVVETVAEAPVALKAAKKAKEQVVETVVEPEAAVEPAVEVESTE